MNTIFVYGTLKRGFGNHNNLMEEAVFIQKDITYPEFTMIDMGGYPAVFEHESKFCVTGEVYSVNYDTLQRLDRLESEGRLYRRVPVNLQSGLIAHTYLLIGEALSESGYQIVYEKRQNSLTWINLPEDNISV